MNSNNYELLLWDNGSTDGTAKYFKELEQLYPGVVSAIINKRNDGFSEPNRRQLAKATGKYFVLLNNDTEVPPGWLQALEMPFIVHKDAALVGVEGTCCHLEVTNGPICLIGKPGMFEYVEGSCLMGRTDLLKKHGLFSDYLDFAYCEDADLSLRMRYLGYSIHQVPLAIKHVRSATSKSVPGIENIMARNMQTVSKKFAHYFKMRRTDHPIVIRRHAARGDVLLATPIIRRLHEEKPTCQILVETEFPEIFDRNPYGAQAARKINVPAGSLEINLNYEHLTETNYVQGYAKCANLGQVDTRLEIFPSKADFSYGAHLLSKPGRWCSIHAGHTGWPGRNWPIERLVDVAQWLINRGWKVVLVNGDKSPEFSVIPHAVDARGVTIHQQAAIHAHCSLFVGIDSFPMHLSQAMGTPAVGIFGATLPQYVMTDGSPHIGVCADRSIKCAGERHRVMNVGFVDCDGACIRSVKTSDVKQAIEELV